LLGFYAYSLAKKMQNYSVIKDPEDFPQKLFAVIEIPMNSGAVKYEIDKNGFLQVDRFLPVSMQYPCNYGFIPNTLGGDMDPLDILVICRQKVLPKSIIKVKPIGVLLMQDEKGEDEKIIAVPTQDVDAFYQDINDIKDIRSLQLDQIKHFFECYKKLEPGKFVKISGWADADSAKKIILESKKRAKKSS